MSKSIFGRVKITTILIAIVAIIFVIVVPGMTEEYAMMVLNLGLIFAIAALGLSIMLGMGGQLSFATVAFMGLGSYITANLCSGRMGFWMDTSLTLIIVILASIVVSFLVGLILFRLSGTFFTFSTIALVQVSWSFFLSYRPLFGGPDGISGIQPLTLFGFTPQTYYQWFYVLCAFLLIMALFVERIRRSQLGRSLGAVRDNEIAAQTLGINVYMTKVIAFTIAGTMAAFAGALYAMHGKFVSSDMFNWERATSYIIMVMLGGVNNTTGVVVGSVLVNMLPEWLRAFKQYLQLIYGIGIILLMVFMPMGLAGVLSQVSKSLKRRFFRDKSNVVGTSTKGEDDNG